MQYGDPLRRLDPRYAALVYRRPRHGHRRREDNPPRWLTWAGGFLCGLILSWLQYAAWAARR